MLCNRCKKRMAILFISKMENGKPVNEGLCLQCARELKLPQLTNIIEQMGISEEEIDAMTEQLSDLADGDLFEQGGADTMPNFMQNMLQAVIKEDKPAEEEEKHLQVHQGKDNKGKEAQGKGKPKPKSKRKFLTTYCTNLTARAQNGELDDIIGREREIYRIVQILSRRSKNNPCLIGEPGVGKTAIAEGIAQKIVQKDVPFRLQNKELFLLDMTALVAGTQFRGQFESRVKGLLDEVKAEGNIILFIDEVHTLVGTGDSEGSMSAANILKPALSRGEIQVIGATTFGEYRKHIEKDSALERRFQPVTVQEPNIEEATAILRGVKKYYEAHHKVRVPDHLIPLLVSMSERYITDRYLPDKAIDLLDEACSCCAIASPVLTEYETLNQTLQQQTKLQEELMGDTEAIDYERLAKAKAEVILTREKLKELEERISDVQLGVADLAKVIELWTGIPAAKIEENEYQKMITLEDRLKEKIIGQDEAVREVAEAIKRSRVQLSHRKRPASFIFVGPTGVGKTEMVKVLSEELFDSVEPLIRLDMTEYMEKHAVSKLIGSPPGYVGYEEAGQLTEKVRRRPYSVILFDEIEKAHPDIMNILLQILDEGRVTDAQGRTVNFENTILAMTSNAGSSQQNGVVGFHKTAGDIAKEKAIKALREFLRPEFLGRVDEVVVFQPLSTEHLAKIAGLMLDEMKKPLAEKDIAFSYDEAALHKLTQLAEGGKYAARDLRRVIRKEVESRVANLLIQHFAMPPKSIHLTVQEDSLHLQSIDR